MLTFTQTSLIVFFKSVYFISVEPQRAAWGPASLWLRSGLSFSMLSVGSKSPTLFPLTDSLFIQYGMGETWIYLPGLLCGYDGVSYALRFTWYPYILWLNKLLSVTPLSISREVQPAGPEPWAIISDPRIQSPRLAMSGSFPWPIWAYTGSSFPVGMVVQR